ncbi:DUF4823 domain-containing protein [Aeromonas sp. R6-2]|uniref:DUF4823 domain-containing protein n=1 Tax=unclassified Aeromonas TaxID=257493 RepID=UPI0034A56C40
MIKKILTTTAMLAVAGCSSTYHHTALQTPAKRLDANLGVLISIPDDGFYETQTYANSGMMTANAVRAAFAKKARNVDITNSCKSNQCLESIDTTRYGYFVKPTILHWEERATEWSGKPDRIEIQLVIYDAITKKELANSSYTGRSKWATFGGDHPQDLLPDPTNAYVSGLYQ